MKWNTNPEDCTIRHPFIILNEVECDNVDKTPVAIATTHTANKFIFALVASFMAITTGTVTAQPKTNLKQENDYCVILERFLNDSVVNETYGIGQKEDSLILVMDTNAFFKHCAGLHVNSKRVAIFHTPKWAGSVAGKPIIPHNEITPGILLEVINHRKPYIVIYKIDTFQDGYKVYSFYRTTGASIVVTYSKQKDNSYKGESYKRGYF